MITVANHKLVDAEGKIKISIEETPNVSGPFKAGLPDTVVIHYTAGGSARSSADWLKNPKAKASAHVVVGKQGEIIQLVPFNIVAQHAGPSTWKGRSGLNQYSIGIEIDNAGVLTQAPDGFYTYFKKKIESENVVLAKHKLDDEVKGWEAYTEVQIQRVEEICLALKDAYGIGDIVGHDDIAPTRKRDPGPAYPMVKLQNSVLFGRDVDLPDEIEEIDIEPAIVVAENLNIRSRPALSSPTVSSPLSRGTRVTIQKKQGEWSYVKAEIEGWVSNNWLRKA